MSKSKNRAAFDNWFNRRYGRRFGLDLTSGALLTARKDKWIVWQAASRSARHSANEPAPPPSYRRCIKCGEAFHIDQTDRCGYTSPALSQPKQGDGT